jgi:ferredoxin
MPKLKIEFDKEACIGNKACLAMDFKRWKDMGDKVDLIDSREVSPGIFVLEGDYSDDEVNTIVEGANVCPVNVIKVTNLDSNEVLVDGKIKEAEMKEVKAEYDDEKEFVMDPAGYFLIRTNKDKKEIEVAFCPEPNKISLKVTGSKPLEIYQTIINKEKLKLRSDHYAYLGRELQKAYTALQFDLEYVQDDELKK